MPDPWSEYLQSLGVTRQGYVKARLKATGTKTAPLPFVTAVEILADNMTPPMVRAYSPSLDRPRWSDEVTMMCRRELLHDPDFQVRQMHGAWREYVSLPFLTGIAVPIAAGHVRACRAIAAGVLYGVANDDQTFSIGIETVGVLGDHASRLIHYSPMGTMLDWSEGTRLDFPYSDILGRIVELAWTGEPWGCETRWGSA